MLVCSFVLCVCRFRAAQVFKLHVQRSCVESWFIFRRYTDFVRLNEKVGRCEAVIVVMLLVVCCSLS